MLGVHYEKGVGVAQSYRDAFRWYEQAAENGCGDAMNRLGAFYAAGRATAADPVRAAELFRAAAEQGSGEALLNLAGCYEYGKGVQQDARKAMELYRQSAEKGNAAADYNMGRWLESQGDMEQAYRHYCRAAKRNDTSAWWALGRFYETGLYVQQDAREAHRCYEKGEALGSLKCRMRLARCKLLGIGTRRAKKRGLELCRSALEQARESAEREEWGGETEIALLERTIRENESQEDPQKP